MDRSEITLVCFDLGGVLVRLSKDWIDACMRAGVTIGADDQRRWVEHQGLLAQLGRGGCDGAGGGRRWGERQVLLAQLERGECDEAVYERRVVECLPAVELRHVLAAFDAWIVGIY